MTLPKGEAKKRANERSKIYRMNNKNKEKSRRKLHYSKNKEKVKQQVKEYRLKNLDKIKLQGKKYYSEHKEELLKYGKKYYANKVKLTVKNRGSYNFDPVSQAMKRKNQRDYKKKYLADNEIALISSRLRNLLGKALRAYTLKGKYQSSKKYGINYKKIIEHLKPFPQDLSKYHLDHIKPLCSFDLTKTSEIKKAFALENHQWLLAKENQSKGGRII